MRLLLVLAICSVVAASTTTTDRSVREKKFVKTHRNNLGEKECTYGPAYWCKNLTTSAECHATKHCIQTVWIHQTLPADHSSVCQTCLEMVKEARDQLLSNETQEEIKEVFEGSCKLLPIKEISKECCKLADQFIPELVDTLASQMDPQVVCSVAGLCNNEHVHQLLQEQDVAITKFKPTTDSRCDGCHTVLEIVDDKFKKATRDQVLAGFLQVCGRMGSLSDACSNIIITYFNDIYNHLENNLNPTDFCLMAGECNAMFHNHANVEVTPLSKIGVVRVDDPDLPCDLCKQLVKHLQDILIANTTESEFHQVLVGICKQTNSFKSECLNIVNEYYPMIYNFLVNELNGTVVCSLINICPGSGLDQDAPIRPLLPAKTVENLQGVIPIVPSNRVVPKPVQELGSPELSQLPIERVFPQTLTLIGNRQLCEFCEYFLHFVQTALTDPKTEESIRRVVDEACDKLPGGLNKTCTEFVNTYGPALVAILAQDIDPSLVCPKLSLCSSSKLPDVEIFMNKGESGKCPLCLLALENLKELIKNQKTEANIRKELGKLCSHLHDNLKDECEDFVQTYTDEIVEGILADLTPEELCVYFKLCSPKTDDKVKPIAEEFEFVYGGHVETNAIPDYTQNGVRVNEFGSQACILCEFVMSQLKQELDNNATEDEIKEVVHGICNHLPKTIKSECDNFVNEYADLVIQLLIQSLEPAQICAELKLCNSQRKIVQEFQFVNEKSVNSPQCAVCKVVLGQIENLLNGTVTRHEVIKAVHEVCNVFPGKKQQECNQFIHKYEDKIISLLELSIAPHTICSLLMVCDDLVSEKPVNEPPHCAECKEILSEVEKLLNGSVTHHEVVKAVHEVCKVFPGDKQQKCNQFINKYEDKIISLLELSIAPNTICNLLRVCEDFVNEQFANSPPQCAFCKVVLNEIEKLLNGSVTDHEVVKAVHEVCKVFPGKKQHECDEFIDKYDDKIISLLELSIAPDSICSLLMICDDHVNAIKLEVRKCTICEGLIGFAEGILQNPSVDHSIEHVFEKSCRAFPEEYQSMCRTLVEVYGEDIFKMLKQEDSSTICSALGLCTTRTTYSNTPALIGKARCTRGPSYWCQNINNAHECGAVEHCQKKVWNTNPLK